MPPLDLATSQNLPLTNITPFPPLANTLWALFITSTISVLSSLSHPPYLGHTQLPAQLCYALTKRTCKFLIRPSLSSSSSAALLLVLVSIHLPSSSHLCPDHAAFLVGHGIIWKSSFRLHLGYLDRGQGEQATSFGENFTTSTHHQIYLHHFFVGRQLYNCQTHHRRCIFYCSASGGYILRDRHKSSPCRAPCVAMARMWTTPRLAAPHPQ